MKITAIICTYNREKFLEKALESLANQTMDKSQFEVLIVNNNSTDNTELVSQKFHEKHPEIPYKYVVETNQGLSYARNRGIKEATAPLVTFIDDDSTLHPEFLQVVTDYLEQHPDVAAVGGKILLDYESKPPRWVSKYLLPLFGYFVYGEEIRQFEKPAFPRGSNMTFRKSVFDQIGMFDVNLGRTGKNMGGNEEKDLFFRIYKTGMKVVYLPNAIVYHAVPDSRTTSEFIKKQALGIGISEKYRTRNSGEYTKAILAELVKWTATMALAVIYIFTIRPAKAIMLIRFRYWVTKGLITKQEL